MYTTYDGATGFRLARVARKKLFAWHFGDLNLLISGNVTDGSRILFHRLIQERVHRVAPFLRLDHDPYLVVADQRAIWLQDAYTVSDALPYSQPDRDRRELHPQLGEDRIDAYDGTVTFFMADPADPLVRTYARIFPTLFRPMEAMSPSLRQHIRYPEDLFRLQAAVYRTYHMDGSGGVLQQGGPVELPAGEPER